MGDPREPVVVFESASPTEIAMARQLLAEAEIPAAVNESGNSSIMSVMGGDPFGGVRLIQVPAEFADRAVEVLEKAWGELDEE